MSALFPDHVITKAEEEIRHHEKCTYLADSKQTKTGNLVPPLEATEEKGPEV